MTQSDSPRNPSVNSGSPTQASKGIGALAGSLLRDLVPGVHMLPGQGNSVAIETDHAVLIVDAGPGGRVTANLIARLREITDKPVSHIVYSHGHSGYNFGVPDWLADSARRGDGRPLVVAHSNVATRYRRYTETAALQALLNGWQFRMPIQPAAAERMVMPDLSFDERLVIESDGRRIELLAAPSETDDVLAVWLPAERFLYASAALIRSLPNVGTPLRTLRDPLRWAETLDRLQALRPKLLLGEFGAPLSDPQEIDDALQYPAAGLRWLRREVVARMNAGMGIDDIVHDIVLPPELFGHRFMRPIYGAPEYVMRDIWRSENGWWDRNPTTLHPAAPGQIASDLQEAIGDPLAVLAQARALAAQGETQRAMHVVDLVAQFPDGAPGKAQACLLKAELAEQRAREVAPVVSRNLYRSFAEQLRGLLLGSTRNEDPTGDFSWN